MDSAPFSPFGCESAIIMIEHGKRYQSTSSFSVECIWYLDTVAILDDYTESCAATLPAASELVVHYVPDDESQPIQCLVPNHKALLKKMIPKKRRNHILCFELPTPFDVLVSRKDLHDNCKLLETKQNGNASVTGGIDQFGSAATNPKRRLRRRTP